MAEVFLPEIVVIWLKKSYLIMDKDDKWLLLAMVKALPCAEVHLQEAKQMWMIIRMNWE